MKIKIVSLDAYNEKYEAIFDLKKGITESGIYYEYFDGNSKNIIYIEEEKVIIVRSGEIESKMLLIKAKESIFEYKNVYMNINMKLYTEKLDINKDGIETTYTLSDDNGIINKITMSIFEIIN